MEITIPFNDWSKKRLRGYRKRATSRNKRYGNVGDTFTVTIQHNEETMEDKVFELTYVERVTLAFVRDRFYDEEGCNSEDEFVAIWNDIHPRKRFDDEHKVWLHLFKELEVVKKVSKERITVLNQNTL